MISTVALLVSAVSAYFSYQSNQAKNEAMRLSVKPNIDCRTVYVGGPKSGQIGLCWAVTLANESENRLSIVDQRVFDIQNGNIGVFGGFQNLEGEDGKPVDLPIAIDGGDSRKIFVRGVVMVPPEVAALIAQMPEYQNHTLGTLPLSEMQKRLALAKTDFIGNKVVPMIVDGRYMGFSISTPMTGAVNILSLTSGRDSVFTVRMVYPPGLDEMEQGHN